jgi:hypothetical protein
VYSHKIRWRRLAILAAGVLGVLLLSVIGIVLLAPNLRRIIQAPYWKTDTQRAAEAAHSMMNYDLPMDYRELAVLTIRGQDAAVIVAHRERPEDLIFVETVMDGILANESWRNRYETRLAREMGRRRYLTQTVATQEAVVRGQPTTLRILEGTDESGRQVRQVVCGFTGKSGDVLLGIVMGLDTWDQPMVDEFLQSIR